MSDTFLNMTGYNESHEEKSDDSATTNIIFVYQVTVRIIIIGLLSAAGIVTNVINIMVFYRQGLFTDSCNASLTGLAVADLLNCVFVLWGSVCYSIAYFVETPNIKFDEVCYLSADRAVLLGSQIICFITTYVAFERFFSVAFPFKVKTILTPARSYIIICCIFVITTLFYAPWLANSYLGWVKLSNNSYELDRVQIPSLTVFLPQWVMVNPISMRIACLIIVLICNFTIHFKVLLSQKFKKSVSGGKKSTGSEESKQSKTNKKEVKLMKMITVICVMFFVGYLTDTLLALTLVLGLATTLSWPVLKAVFEASTFCFTVNSSCNIIVYYTMSTRYRQEFKLLLCDKKDTIKNQI